MEEEEFKNKYPNLHKAIQDYKKQWPTYDVFGMPVTMHPLRYYELKKIWDSWDGGMRYKFKHTEHLQEYQRWESINYN
jgi:hypothetical protein